MIFNGVDREQKASKGTSIYIHNKWKESMKDKFINERITVARKNKTIKRKQAYNTSTTCTEKLRNR